jgi:hypothetical protein
MTFTKAIRSPFDFFKSRQSTRAMISEESEADWSPECAAFRDYWSRLRVGADLPTSEAFLDAPSPRFAGFVFVLEMLDGVPIVRLQGTQLEQAWSRDLTGGDFFPGRSPRFRAAGIANLTTVLSQPCGHLARSSYATSKGRKITSDWIFLPVAVREGRAPRIVGAVFQHGRRGTFAEVGILHFELHKVAWLDAGWGLPAAQPIPLAD